MAVLLGSQPTPLDDTTMVVYRGSRKPVLPERKRDLARRCGINFIRLMYKENLTSTIGVSGFQHVKLRTQPRKGGGTEPVAQWHVNMFSNKAMAEGAMDFIPDEMGTGWAYLPDSPFNRIRLAYAEIAQNALWTIDDNQIRDEILILANEIKKSIDYQKEMEELKSKQTETLMRVQEKNIKLGVEHKTRLEIEVQVMEKKLEEMELIGRREELKRKIVEFQSNHPEVIDKKLIPETNKQIQPTIQSTPEPEVQEDEVTDNEIIDQNTLDIIREKAKLEIHEENKELIESIKEEYLKTTGKNRGWAFSPKYREKILPLIEQRINELKEKNEHSTIGVVT